ncbi:unnamed protein product [Orchesella dallaii]|uniref:G-protein coupled receptors family 1 profile domain-containing protein n=1 Tax=Orchesella dallaii TaxID=48710 RepID=A0ABP1S2Y1_9HEXA
MDTDQVPPRNISLPYWTCFFLNSENGVYPAENNTFYTCRIQMRYILDSECRIRDENLHCGYWICVIATVAIALLANFGIFTNILNLLILPKSLQGCSVKRLMVLLAIFDLLVSVCAIPYAILLLLITGRYETTYVALEAFKTLSLLFSLGRTGSIFVTIMIAIERYIAVAFPLKQWLTNKKARIHLIIVLIIVALVNLPWWLNKSLERNEMFQATDANGNYTSDLSRFPYIYKSSYFANKIYRKFVLYHMLIDFASPFPLLLIFNGLLYRSIYISNKIRQTLTTSQRREVNAAKMFSIVALILLLCHSVAVVIFITNQVHGVTFRELQFFQMLAVTINASINFIIYYAFGKSFRDEFWTVVRACKLFRNKMEQAAVTPASSTMGTVEMGVTTKTRSARQK